MANIEESTGVIFDENAGTASVQGAEVDTETGEIKAAPSQEEPSPEEEGRGDKKKRVRRGKEEMAAARKQEEDAIREAFFKELQDKGLIRREDELADAVNPNLEIYNRLRKVPAYACKPIDDGPLKGLTDINPQLRIKQLTAIFGPAGRNWYTRVTECRILEAKTGQQMAHVAVDLYVRYDGEWSQPIGGMGGSPLLRSDGRMDDEAFKKAETDAISVCCKKLGMCADVYFKADAAYGTKYDEFTPSVVPSEAVAATPSVQSAAASGIVEKIPVAAPATTETAPAENAGTEEKSAPVPAPSAASASAPAKAAPAPAPRMGLSGRCAAPVPAGTRPELKEGSSTWYTIQSYLAMRPDKSPEAIDSIKTAYSKKLVFDDSLWSKLCDSAGVQN